MKPVEIINHIGKMPNFIPMKYYWSLIMVLPIALVFGACTSTQISSALKTYNDLSEDNELSSEDVIAGLKEALVIGAETGTDLSSQPDGFFLNPEIKIPFPSEMEEVEVKLRQLGLNKLVDDFTLSLNRAAEKASAEAKPLFIEAIRRMSIEDAWGVLRGEDDAATQYLRKTTSAQLEVKFKPIIEDALNTVDATKYYRELTTTYNRIPFVTKVETDLNKYVMEKALDGLFLMVANEESKIRKDPVARTTELLERVFSQQ